MADAGHRLDALGVDLVQLLDPGEDLGQLTGKARLLLLGHLDARQGGDARHGGLVQCHDVGVLRRVPERIRLPPAMPICNPTELKPLLAKGVRLLGLDVGTKTIGMALSDTTLTIATPFDTIRRIRFRDDLTRLLAEIDPPGVGGLVVGLPLALDGSDTPRARGVRQFAKNLAASIDRPIAFWDER